MQQLCAVSAHRKQLRVARVGALLALTVLTVIFQTFASGANITYNYTTGATFSLDGYRNEPLPVAGFDTRLGLLQSATLELEMAGNGWIYYRCDPLGDCGQWAGGDSPEGPEWIPNLYPYPVPWSVEILVSAYPESPSDPGSGPIAGILSGVRRFVQPAGMECETQVFCLDQKVTFSGTSSDPIFQTDSRLMISMLGTMFVENADPGTYQFVSGWFQGPMSVSLRYDYATVPEPALKELTLLALLSLPLSKKLSARIRAR